MQDFNPAPPKHFSEDQHALHAGLRLVGLYFCPVDFELIWAVQSEFSKKGNIDLQTITKIETEIRSKYEADGVTLKSNVQWI